MGITRRKFIQAKMVAATTALAGVTIPIFNEPRAAESPFPPLYIDPTYSGIEAGTEAQPYSTWSAVLPLQDNRTYLIRAGTTLEEEVTIKDANGVTVDIYGGSKMAIIDGQDARNRCVVYGSCDNLVIRHLHATRGRMHGFLMENGAMRDFGPILIEDCRADYITANSTGVGSGVGFQLNNINNVKVSLLTVRRVTCEFNGRMGFDQQQWGGNAEYYDIVSRFNGGLAKGGGFFTHPWRLKAEPWIDIGGGLWEWTLPSPLDDPGYVEDAFDDEFGKPFIETFNPTPSPGEFYHDVTNRKLVVNLYDPAGDPNIRGISVARSTINVLVDGAEIAYNGSPNQDIDATGFQFDDMSHNVIGRNIHSHHNLGTGIACHRAFNALIEDSVSEYNALDQVRDKMWMSNFAATGATVATWRNITARGDGNTTIRAVTVGRDCRVRISGLTSEGHSEMFFLRERATVELIPAAISKDDRMMYDVDAGSKVLGEQYVFVAKA